MPKKIVMRNVPNPGSDAAVHLGCSCPQDDNARGRGAWGTSGDDAVFWVNDNCPLHGDNKEKEIERDEH